MSAWTWLAKTSRSHFENVLYRYSLQLTTEMASGISEHLPIFHTPPTLQNNYDFQI